MFQITQIYTNPHNFKKFVLENNLDPSEKCLVRVFTDYLGKETIQSIIRSIKEVLPNASVVGATSSGAVIYKSTQFEEATIVVVNTFERIKVRTMIFDWENMSPKKVLQTLKKQYSSNQNQVNILFSNTCGLLYDILDDFVHHTNLSHPFINFVGGVAGNVEDNGVSKSYVFCDDVILENGIVAFSYEALHEFDVVEFFTHTSVAADEISDYHEVTSVNGNQILSIDNIPAIDWFYDYLDIENDEKISLDEFKKIAGDVHFSGFSVISNKHNDTSRCVLYDNENYIVSLFSSKMSVGSKFKVGYLNPKRVLNESFNFCGRILQSNIQSIFVYSCSARKSFLKSAAALELIPLHQNDVSGIFLLGEICNQDGKNNLYNASCCLIGFSEREYSHLHVDTSMLIQENIDSDMRFFSKAFNKYQEIGASYEDTSNSKYYDTDYNLPNVLKYNYDVTKNMFDKIVLVDVLTADSTISLVGKSAYIAMGHEMFAALGKFFDKLNVSEHVNIYALDYKSFVVTFSNFVSEARFIEVATVMHDRFGFVTSKESDISAITRYVVVLNQDDLLKTAISTLYAHRSSQNNLIFSGSETAVEIDTIANESFMISVLKKAIDDKTVTPYFQGMMNNITNKIDKYEALMRITDGETVYTPDKFLDIAKRFKLYPEISKQMISKALDIFDGSLDTLSINVSLYDIESESLRNWLLDRLRNFKYPEKVVVEFVETEECNDLNIIKEFIKDVHSVGSLIAIDDFGSGYSTFATIIGLKPDIIKIDGSIISGIVKNSEHLKVMKTICYLADSLNIATIAEFVDSPHIQELVVECGINHSQGYLFSKPTPTPKITRE